MVSRLFLLISLIFLQSCSGGKIGNFLESSFKNIEGPKIKEDIQNNSNNKIFINSNGIAEKNKNIKDLKIKKEIKNNLKNNKSKKTDNKSKKTDNKLKNYKKFNEKNISLQKRNYQPQSYKIIFILKDVDPKDPTEDLRNILRNSDVNFEIEKIERFLDPKIKSIKTN